MQSRTRIALQSKDAIPRHGFRAVPREAPDVYREMELTNPFQAPLLAGPVDVHANGSLLATAHIDCVDRGGKVRIGLGVEDRIRVARNVRVEEETIGLLGGTIAVRHHVQVELRSSLGFPATVEVVDRIPDTDDKQVELKLLGSKPPAERYTQRSAARRFGAACGGPLPCLPDSPLP